MNVASVQAVATSEFVAWVRRHQGWARRHDACLSSGMALVRVNAVLPRAVATQMLEDGMSRRAVAMDEFKERQPLGPVGPGEIAQAVYFLAANTFTTGAVLIVHDGPSTDWRSITNSPVVLGVVEGPLWNAVVALLDLFPECQQLGSARTPARGCLRLPLRSRVRFAGRILPNVWLPARWSPRHLSRCRLGLPVDGHRAQRGQMMFCSA